MPTTTQNPTPAVTPSGMSVIAGSASAKRRFVTVVYEIKDDAAWRDGGNPLHYEHHGLKSVCVSAGDLALLNEEIMVIMQEGNPLTPKKYDELHQQHVMSCFPGR